MVGHFVQRFDVQGKARYRNKAILLGLKRMKDKHGAVEVADKIVKLVLEMTTLFETFCSELTR